MSDTQEIKLHKRLPNLTPEEQQVFTEALLEMYQRGYNDAMKQGDKLPAKTGTVFVRAQIMGELLSGQKYVAIYANGADGVRFYTDDKSLVYYSDIVKSILALEEEKTCNR